MTQVPRARQDGLIVKTLPDEVLVYDLERHKALCLNLTAALVWKHCDGRTSVAKIARLLGMRVDVVSIALDKLGKSHLLGGRISRTPKPISRRNVIKGALIALPVVIAISAPMPADAQSGCAIVCSSDAECIATPGCPPRCVGAACVP